jgi:AAA15 family ATPase/GTPase
MLHFIEIENFRCFQKTRLEGFGRVNLLGGRNNAGKTALLEAILLNCSFQPKTIDFLRTMRGEQHIELNFTNFFYNEDKTNKIILNSDLSNNQVEYGSDTLLYIQRKYKDSDNRYRINTKDDNLYQTEDDIYKGVHAVIFKKINFLQATGNVLDNTQLAQLYSEANLKPDTEEPLLEALRVIEKTIKRPEINVIGLPPTPTLYLRKMDGRTQPIKMFGDAMQRVAEFILTLVTTSGGVLLIDEVENGIHYKNQQRIWEILLDLSKVHNVQIFATTHSREMITAFANAAETEAHKSEARYFEMYVSGRSNQIIGTAHDIDTLQYKLKNNIEFRGGSDEK